jgi:steroid delta-isomerase-like uncharacterized protein
MPGVAPAMSRADVDAFDDRWLAAWNAHDADAVAALCSGDVAWREPAKRRELRGRDDVRRRVAVACAALPDLVVERLHLFVDEAAGCAAAPWRVSGTFLGSLEPSGLPPTGRHLTFDGVDLWWFGPDGLLARVQEVYDLNAIAVQAGVGPAVPSARRASGVHRLTARTREALRR